MTHASRGEGLMPKLIKRMMPILATLLLAVALITPVLAQGGGHLWFYSQDPGDPPLPNPQDWDPNYVNSDPNPWLDESIVITSGDWDTPFTIWLACAQFESLDTMLVVSINDAAFEAIDSITVNGIPLEPWTDGTPVALAPHGVFNSAEFYGYDEVNVGDLYSPPGTPFKVAIVVDIDLNEGADLSNAKIHFDAYGYTNTGGIIFSPYSHDTTFVVPEPATIIMMASALGAFGIYAYKRKR